MAEKKTSKSADLTKIVLALAKEGHPPAKIGLILRDKHQIPRAKLLGKKVTQILKENNVEFKTEKTIIADKIENIKSHLGKNKHDYTAQKSLSKRLWQHHKIEKLSAN
tara:strand:- start:1823 stop:2146 length:324 start_codon:yes stop_codon:yes gene_type:complete